LTVVRTSPPDRLDRDAGRFPRTGSGNSLRIKSVKGIRVALTGRDCILICWHLNRE
jgi:hypothetical protein